MLRWLKTAAVKPGLPDPQKANTPEKKYLIKHFKSTFKSPLRTTIWSLMSKLL